MSIEPASVRTSHSVPPRKPAVDPQTAKVPPAPQALPPATDIPQARARARSLEPPPLQDCTNTPANAAAPSCAPQEGNNTLRPNPAQGNGQQQSPRYPSFKGKGSDAKGGGKGSARAPGANGRTGEPGAPDWWTKMAVPGKQAPMGAPQTVNKGPAQPAPQARDDDNGPRLTSTILRAHEVKMATAESIARYSNAARPNTGPNTVNRGGPPPGWRPPPIPEQRPAGRGKDENCVIS